MDVNTGITVQERILVQDVNSLREVVVKMIEQTIIVVLIIVVITLTVLLIIQSRRYKHVRKITKPCKEYTRELRKSNELIREQLRHCNIRSARKDG